MISQFLTEAGRVNSSKLKATWLEKNMPKLVEQLELEYSFEGRLVEKIWLLNAGLKAVPVCKHCGQKPTKFKGLLLGYSDFCSNLCHNRSSISAEKKAQAYRLKYGVDNPFQADEVKRKIEVTSLSKYGETNPSKAIQIKERAKATNRQRYGTDWGLSGESLVRQQMNQKNELEFREMCEGKGIVVKTWSTKKFGIVDCVCDKGHEFKLNKWQIYQRAQISNTEVCTVCNPFGSFSETGLERKIVDWLSDWGVKYVQRDRTRLDGQEIDVFVPKLGLGIELNGVYWHSDSFKDREYHQAKSDLAERAGIQLIQVWEDQLQNSEEIVKSMLMSRLRLIENRIWARKCEIVKLSSAESTEFFSKNHLQGSVPSRVRLGLKFNGRIVAAMTFGSLRKSLGVKAAPGAWELYRFAAEAGTTVVGGASKLMTEFIKIHSPARVMSFAMRDWSTGSMYRKLGFIEAKRTSPSYWYIEKNSLTRHHRFSFRKDALVKNGADPRLSEHQIMQGMNYHRIWDSGQLLFEWTA